MYLDQNSLYYTLCEEVIREDFLRRMDINKELEAVQKKLDSIKKSQEMIQKIQELEEKKQINTGMKATSHNYEMM